MILIRTLCGNGGDGHLLGVGRRPGEVSGLHSDWLTYLAFQVRWEQFEKSFVMPAICATSTSHSVQSVGRVHVQRHNEVADRASAPDLLARLHSRPLNLISELVVGCPITREECDRDGCGDRGARADDKGR